MRDPLGFAQFLRRVTVASPVSVPLVSHAFHTLSQSLPQSAPLAPPLTASPTLSPTSTAPPALLAPLYSLAPVFPVNANSISVLSLPADFYTLLKQGIASAKRRIVLASLYIGHDETELTSLLAHSLRTVPTLTVHILIDHLRGTRGHPHSSAALLAPLVDQFPDRCTVSMWHTPRYSGAWRYIVPQRFNEAFGLMHVKCYVFDDDVVLSG
ncbi:CDP-diacylglycerol--glycerol-3-phosphate 3-phosphatidyltransferase [Gonapodya sp. JEL0774]|nr:CDP-diacylglycerol--glycerol-3-phosphate 3-phosphatidyltransferase [Gonapodya sp. JEL0774]